MKKIILILIITMSTLAVYAQDYRDSDQKNTKTTTHNKEVKEVSIITSETKSESFSIQPNENVLKKHTKSSQSGLEEIKELTKSNPELSEKVIRVYKDLNAKGKIILSSKEYVEVQNQIDVLNKSNLSEDEQACYNKIRLTYVNVKDLTSK